MSDIIHDGNLSMAERQEQARAIIMAQLNQTFGGCVDITSQSYDAWAGEDVDNIGNLKLDDLKVAVEFFHAISTKGDSYIVIQCPTHKDIPYVKRALIAELGEPSKNLGNELHWSARYLPQGTCLASSSKRIIIQPVLINNISGIIGDIYSNDNNRVFYVGWESGQDLIKQVRAGVKFVKTPMVMDIWKSIGVDAYTAYNKWRDEGYDPEQALEAVDRMGELMD